MICGTVGWLVAAPPVVGTAGGAAAGARGNLLEIATELALCSACPASGVADDRVAGAAHVHHNDDITPSEESFRSFKSIAGTVPGGYPDPLRGGFKTVVMMCRAQASTWCHVMRRLRPGGGGRGVRAYDHQWYQPRARGQDRQLQGQRHRGPGPQHQLSRHGYTRAALRRRLRCRLESKTQGGRGQGGSLAASCAPGVSLSAKTAPCFTESNGLRLGR